MRSQDQNPKIVQIKAWERYPWLWHGFSTRGGGVTTVYQASAGGADEISEGNDLNLGWTKDDDAANVAENRLRFISAVTGDMANPPQLVTVRQTHSPESLVVPANRDGDFSAFVNAEGRAVREADGLLTASSGLLLGIQTADCVPVLVADTRLRVVAGFHAGWRGTASRIVERGVAQMRSEFGSSPDDLIAAIGPSIGACCYSVGDAVYEQFAAGFGYGESLFRRGRQASGSLLAGQYYLDLWEANRRQLLDSGVSTAHIERVGECTGCAGLPGRRKYFSHRLEEGFTGRMLSVIGIAEHPSGSG